MVPGCRAHLGHMYGFGVQFPGLAFGLRVSSWSGHCRLCMPQRLLQFGPVTPASAAGAELGNDKGSLEEAHKGLCGSG